MSKLCSYSNTPVLAGIVTFNPDISRLRENITSVIGQVNELYIFDNCSNNQSEILSVCNEYKISYSFAKRNIGLGNALNAAMLYAYDNGYEFAYLLDQDSVTSPNAVSSQLSHADEDVAVVSPVIVDRNKTQRSLKTHLKAHEIKRPITSGSLVQVAAWYLVGGFDGEMFIDYIDYEFDERCLRNGYRLVEDGSVFLLQEGGHAEPSLLVSGVTYQNGKFGFKHPYRYNYSSRRLFMRYRNATVFIRRYSYDTEFVLKEMTGLVKNIIHDVVVEKNKKSNFNAIIRGIKYGLADKTQLQRDCVRG